MYNIIVGCIILKLGSLVENICNVEFKDLYSDQDRKCIVGENIILNFDSFSPCIFNYVKLDY